MSGDLRIIQDGNRSLVFETSIVLPRRLTGTKSAFIEQHKALLALIHKPTYNPRPLDVVHNFKAAGIPLSPALKAAIWEGLDPATRQAAIEAAERERRYREWSRDARERAIGR